jgi:acyl-CoA thioester hydrolase
VMGHMNVGYYAMIFAQASRQMTSLAGITEAYIAQERSGAFMLRNYSQFISEARAGETVDVYTRLVAGSEKRVQYMHFMVNRDENRLTATMEVLTTHADLVARRSTPFPPEIVANIERVIAEHNQLDWSSAPTCGLLAP